MVCELNMGGLVASPRSVPTIWVRLPPYCSDQVILGRFCTSHHGVHAYIHIYITKLSILS